MKQLIYSVILLLSLASCKKTPDKVNTEASLYASYSNRVDSIVSRFDSNSLNKRTAMLSKVHNTQFYQQAILKKNINAKNLKILNFICSGIMTSTPDGYILPESEMNSLTQDEKQFAINLATLSLCINGGATRDLIDLFENHKNKFGFYGKAGKLFMDNNGVITDTLIHDFELTPFFIMMDNNDKKALDAVFESRINNVRNWENKEIMKDSFFMPYLLFKDDYQRHLSKVYRTSRNFFDFAFEGNAGTLVSEYKSNEIVADKKYKHINVLLRGKILRVEKDLGGNNIIALGSNNIMSDVICIVDESDALKVKSGQNIEICGKVRGMVMSNVILDNCRIY